MCCWCSTGTEGMWCTQDPVWSTRSWVVWPHWGNVLLLHPPSLSPNSLCFDHPLTTHPHQGFSQLFCQQFSALHSCFCWLLLQISAEITILQVSPPSFPKVSGIDPSDAVYYAENRCYRDSSVKLLNKHMTKEETATPYQATQGRRWSMKNWDI